jgi:hypothetical protein
METTRIDDISANQIRAKLASELGSACLPHLGECIAITGSVARGIADRFSDVEMSFWVDNLEPVNVYLEWLRSTGAVVDEKADLQLMEGQYFTTKSDYRGLLFEITWETWDSLENLILSALAGNITDHWKLTKIWNVADAVPLRNHVNLEHWQEVVKVYPDALQTALVNDAMRAWAEPHGYPLSIIQLWALTQRNTRLALSDRLVSEVERGLRIIWALNRRWEPDWKWLELESRKLSNKPVKLSERVNTIFSTVNAGESVRLCLQLLLETLELLPPPH